MYKVYFKVQSQLNNALYPSSLYIQYFWKKMIYKPKNAIKVAKDLPHLCPWHQPNKEKVSNVHKVNNNKPPIIIYVT